MLELLRTRREVLTEVGGQVLVHDPRPVLKPRGAHGASSEASRRCKEICPAPLPHPSLRYNFEGSVVGGLYN